MIVRFTLTRHVLMINQYYPPDLASTGQIMAEVCTTMAQKGIEVRVVAGQPSYSSAAERAPWVEVRDGVQIHRVYIGGWSGRERMWRRVTGYATFLAGAFRLATTLTRRYRPDIVVTFHNPPFVGLLGAHLSRVLGTPFVYILYDIHPDVLVATRSFWFPAPIVWLWDTIHRRILTKATAVIVLTEAMRSTIIQKGVLPERVHVVPLWGRPEIPPEASDKEARRDLNLPEQGFVALYAGNMGVMHPVEPILEAAGRLKDTNAHFVFLGEGVRRESVQLRISRDRLSNVHLHPYQPEERFVRFVLASDVCIVALDRGVEHLAVPSRTYTFLSAGKPILAVMSADSEIGALIRETSCGWVAGTANDIEVTIRRLVEDRREIQRAAEASWHVYRERFRRELALSSYLRILGGELQHAVPP